MPIRAGFGFGENVGWTSVKQALREQQISSKDCRSQWYARTNVRRPALVGPGSNRNKTKWITRRGAKVDRVACPWLIKRFVDPEAEFIFVAEDELLSTAARLNAIPFDAPRLAEVKLNHRGPGCTFDALIEDYKLTDPTLQRLAVIVRGADIEGQEHVSMESLGLRAIALGFALTGISDAERLAREFPIYDALYEYLRRQAG